MMTRANKLKKKKSYIHKFKDITNITHIINLVHQNPKQTFKKSTILEIYKPKLWFLTKFPLKNLEIYESIN